jgi:hypothetical protein
MRTVARLKVFIVGGVFAAAALHADRAAADPMTVGIFLDAQLRGAQVVEQLQLTFPAFTVSLDDVTHLMPGFCVDQCGNGTVVPFTQKTGPFSGHAVGGFGNQITADVSGNFSFVGPTDTVTLDQFGQFFASENVRFSGMLTVNQGPQVLFNGSLMGSGTANYAVENVGVAGPRLGGYEYQVNAVSATPEPASMVLLGSGILWLVPRRRKGSSRRS